MIRFRILFLLSMALVLGVGIVGAQFEGIVESRNVTTDETGTRREFVMTFWLKGNLVKIVVSPIGDTPASTIVYRKDLGTVWMLNNQEKSYFEIAQRNDRSRPSPPAVPSDPDKPIIRRSGKKRMILGHKCDQVFIRHAGAETEYWGTQDLGPLAKAISDAFNQDAGEPGGGWNDELARMGYFPLVVYTRLNGRVIESSLVSRIKPSSVRQEEFDLPKGYRKQGVRELLPGR